MTSGNYNISIFSTNFLREMRPTNLMMGFHHQMWFLIFLFISFCRIYAQHTVAQSDSNQDGTEHSTITSISQNADVNSNDREYLLHYFNQALKEQQTKQDETNQEMKQTFPFYTQLSEQISNQRPLPYSIGESLLTHSCINKSEDQPEESRQHSHWQPLSPDALRPAQLQQLSAAPSFDPTSIAWFDSPINQLMRRYALSSLDSAMLTVNITPPIGLNLSHHLVNTLSNGNESSLPTNAASHDTRIQTNEASENSSNNSQVVSQFFNNQTSPEKLLQQMFGWPQLSQLPHPYIQRLLHQQLPQVNNLSSDDSRNSSQLNSYPITTPKSLLKGSGNAIVVYPPNFAYSAEDEPTSSVSSSPSGQMHSFSLNQENEEEPEEASMPPLSRSYPRAAELRPARSRYRHQSPSLVPEAAPSNYPDYSYHSENVRPYYRRRPLHRPSTRLTSSHQIDASLPIDYEPPMRAVHHRPAMNNGFRPLQPPSSPPTNEYSYSQMVQFMQNRNRRPNNRPRNPYQSHYNHNSHHHHHHHHDNLHSTHNLLPSTARKPSAAIPASTDLDRATSSTLSDHKNIRNNGRRGQTSHALNSDSTDVTGSDSNIGYGKRLVEGQRISSTGRPYETQVTVPNHSSVSNGRQNLPSSPAQFRSPALSSDSEHNDHLTDRPVNEDSSSHLESGQDSGNSGSSFSGKPDERPTNEVPNSARHEDYRPDDISVNDELRHPDLSQNDRRPLSEHEDIPPEEPVESGDSEAERGEKSKSELSEQDIRTKPPSSYSMNGYLKHSSKSPGYMSHSSRPSRTRSRTRSGYPRHFKNYQIYEKYYKNNDLSAETADMSKFPPTRLSSGSSLASTSDDEEVSALAMSAKASAMAGEFGHSGHSGPGSTIGLGGFYYPYYKHGRKPSIFDNGGSGFSHIFGPPAGEIPMFDPLLDRPLLGEKLPLDPKTPHSHFLEPQSMYDLRPLDAKLHYLEGNKMLAGSPVSGHPMPHPQLAGPPPHSHFLDYKAHPMEHSKYHHHHHEPKQGFGSWQSGLVGFLLGVVPFSMLMASVVPAMSAGAIGAGAMGRRRRRRRQIDDEQSNQASDFLRLATSENSVQLEQIQQSPHFIRKRLQSFGKQSKMTIK